MRGLGEPGLVKGEAVPGLACHGDDGVPGLLKRGVRLGELRVHHNGHPPRPQPGDQRERLGRTRGREDFVTAPAVTPGHRRARGNGVGIGSRGADGVVQRTVEPGGPVPGEDVYREVEVPLPRFRIAVVAQRITDGGLRLAVGSRTAQDLHA